MFSNIGIGLYRNVKLSKVEIYCSPGTNIDLQI